MELTRISILWLVLFCVNIHFQILCIVIEDTTVTTAPPAKAPLWHHQTPTTDKVALMTSSIFFIEQVHRVFLGLVLDSNWLLDYVIGLWLGFKVHIISLVIFLIDYMITLLKKIKNPYKIHLESLPVLWNSTLVRWP